MATLTRITPNTPAYGSEQDCVAAINAEAAKATDDVGGRPLPLVSHWHAAFSSGSSNGLDLDWQIDQIKAGYPYLPHLDVTLTGMANTGSTGWAEVKSYGLPITLMRGTAWEIDLYQNYGQLPAPADYQNVSYANFPLQVTSKATISSITATNPIEVTFSAAHGWTDTVSLHFSGLTGGFSALNSPTALDTDGSFICTVTAADKVTVPINGTGYSAHSGDAFAWTWTNNVSLLADDSQWAVLGAAYGAAANSYAGDYASPPRVVLISNNEFNSLDYDELDDDVKMADLVSLPSSDAEKIVNARAAYLARRAAFDAAFLAEVPANWDGVSNFIGYNSDANSVLYRLYGATDTLVQQLPDNSNALKLAANFTAWQGTSGGNYEGIFSNPTPPSVWGLDTGACLWSPQGRAMVKRYFWDKSEALNADAWNELLLWDREYNVDSTGNAWYSTSVGITYDEDYYQGWSQYCLWMTRPRCLREWRASSADYNGTWRANYYQRLINIVSYVHSDSTLTRFWRDGAPVNNDSYIPNGYHTYQQEQSADGSYDISSWSKASDPLHWRHLTTDYDYDPLPTNRNPYRINTEGNRPWPVWTLAYVIGSSPNREWLIYAHATGITTIVTAQSPTTLSNVTVTIPDYDNVVLPEVPVEGAFYLLTEQDNQIARPESDVSSTGWTVVPDGSAYAALDETLASDTDYCATTATGSTLEVALGSVTNPMQYTGLTLSYRGMGAYTASLRQGADTEIASWQENDSTLTTHQRTLTTGEVAAITDYSDLRVRIVSGGS